MYFWVTKTKIPVLHNFDKSKHLAKWATSLANLSPPWFWNFYPIVIRHSNRHLKLNKSTYRFFSNIVFLLEILFFSMPMAKSPKNEVVFWVFDYKKFIFKQNGHDIRNQYEKLHRITYILSKTISPQKPTRTPPQVFFTKIFGEVPYGLDFEGK